MPTSESPGTTTETAAQHPSRWIEPRAYLLLAAPITILAAGALFLQLEGYPIEFLAQAVIPDGNAEAAARLRALATFFLLSALGLACLAYSAWDLWGARSKVGALPIAVFVLLVCTGLVAVRNGLPDEAQRFLGEQEVCASFELLETSAADRRVGDADEEKQGPIRARRGIPRDASQPTVSCRSDNFALLRRLSDVQRYLLAAVIPAVMLGAISCWSNRGSIGDRNRRKARLKNYLYLSSALFVAGLLFLSALMRWPGYGLHPMDAAVVRQHVDSVVFYWSVVYSLFLASLFVPVGLAHRQSGPAATEEGQASDPLENPASLLKLAASVFAPVIVGLLGDVIKI